jgi:hypothetical protein
MFKSLTIAILGIAVSATCLAQSPAPQVCKNWTAVHRSGVLTVKGSCTVLVQSKLSLTAAVPQGINPDILLLNLKIKPPIGIHSELMLAKPVSYVKRTTKKYKSVSIDGNTDVPVTNH